MLSIPDGRRSFEKQQMDSELAANNCQQEHSACHNATVKTASTIWGCKHQEVEK